MGLVCRILPLVFGLSCLAPYSPPLISCIRQSFLVEITGVIFGRKDDLTDDGYVVDKILDKTGVYRNASARRCSGTATHPCADCRFFVGCAAVAFHDAV